MKEVSLIFPHQLFNKGPQLEGQKEIYLIEEFLFFRQYAFHKQKITFHRASMKAYENYLVEHGKEVHYIDSNHRLSDIRLFDAEIQKKNIGKIHIIDPTDDWLEKRLMALSDKCQIQIYENKQFISSKVELTSFFRPEKTSFFQTTFYKQQRKKRGILMEGELPKGGKWTFDTDNRKKFPKGKTPPAIQFPERSPYWDEAVEYTEKYFGQNIGVVSRDRWYPITHEEAKEWLDQFLEMRFYDFGAYEDAMVKEAPMLNHSLLSPLINVGLLTPDYVVERALSFAEENDIPINSAEGFIRQIIGWREFIRGMYMVRGSYSRTRNFWGFFRKIPKSFYDGTTGIDPVDHVIKGLLKTGYCHHIERLMVLGNFMLLCEFDPDEVYRWFMEFFIDAYDWVMVPNVYGMSLFADGGTFATKPYIGGSNYIKKMSNFGSGNWEAIWDGLFWRFIITHEDFFRSNPRLSMIVHSMNRMSADKKQNHLKIAEHFLSGLD